MWRLIKGGKTDAEVVFGLVVARLNGRQRLALNQKLTAVQFAVTIAATISDDARIKEAQEWTDGALDILGE
jgi:hypothetical protein